MGGRIVLEPDEKIVLSLTGEALNEKAIQRALGWSEHRVQFTMGSLYWKFGASNQEELVAQAFLRRFLRGSSKLRASFDDHEIAVLVLLAQGKETRDITRTTHRGTRRITEGLTLLYKKLRVKNRLGAVVQAFRCGLLHSGNVPLNQPGRERGGWQGISPREREFLQLVKYHFWDEEIEKTLGITPNNLHQIRWRIHTKLRVKTDQEAVAIADKQGILD